ncbi:RNB domain-containing ribonuclease [Acetobacter sp. DsW_063]|uniref:RNB domain-containing ribonuclease n=1 Tax=Acetobacter sp. DsW_063 TaxID=1514894 RepID=UPI000A39384C|nr:RNB domain-containing ribonuclease [Acetobacter sp. DsW_063]
MLQVLSRTAGALGPGDLLRALGLGPGHKAALRTLLHDMALEGAFASLDLAERIRGVRDLPDTAYVVVTGFDRNDRPIARFLDPERARGEGRAGAQREPVIFMAPEQPGRPPLTPGAKVLARLRKLGTGRFEGRTLRTCDVRRLVGRLSASSGEERLTLDAGRAGLWSVEAGSSGDVGDAVVAVAEPVSGASGRGGRARLLATFGYANDPAVLTAMSLHEHGLPAGFSDEAMTEAEAFGDVDAAAALADGRVDYRDTPFMTIDGADSRDFDDAVWAARDGDGFLLRIAIADVAHYVRPDGALDREARERGHSVYLPGLVVPMLPPRLSDDLCSLRPDADRLCVVFEIPIDIHGHAGEARIARGVMRSRARLTYEQAQEMHDGAMAGAAPGSDVTALLGALFATHDAVRSAAVARGVSVVERQERKVTFDPLSGRISVRVASRLDSHRLIESFMTVANHAAARIMRRCAAPGLFRVNPPIPDADAGIEAQRFAAARYSASPAPHAALALDEYAHVTSPIRRYADLLCHRALDGRANRCGKDTLESRTVLASHLRLSEARSAGAARDAEERLIVFHLAGLLGASLDGHVSGETPSGYLVTLTDTGAIGLLIDETALHDHDMPDSINRVASRSRAPGGEDTVSGPSRPLRLAKGTAVRVRLSSVDPVAARCRFSLVAVNS